MNCDQVFDILTRGPFPTGTSCDVPVEAHLSDCPECHRLAEALRPAIELFQEAVDPEESRDLPGYWCAVATERQSPVVSYAREIEPRAVAPQFVAEAAEPGPYSALAMWRMAAMVAVGITVGTLLSARAFDGFRWPPQNGATAVAPAPADDDGLRFTEADWMELAALPAACSEHKAERSPRYTQRHDLLLADARLENLNCCSGCHNSGSESVPSTATLRVSQSCQYCHTESPASPHSAR